MENLNIAAMKAELQASVEGRLGHALSDDIMDVLDITQNDLRVSQQALLEELDNQKIGNQEYLLRLNKLLRKDVERCETLLGHDQFIAIFGKPVALV